MSELPKGWVTACISDLADLNPKQTFEDHLAAGFVPMSHAPTNFREKLRFDDRNWGDIKKAYTNFKNGDVIFAKVTPCFENGKAAFVEGLPNGIGAGSSEFYVLRPYNEDVSAKYLLALVKSREFMREGALNMTGAVGLRRVPKQFVESYPALVPPAAEQTRIAQKIDELLAQVDTLKDRIDSIPALLKRFRQSVLAAAVSGKLTEEWHEENHAPDFQERTIGELFKLIDGDRGPNYPKKEDYQESEYCLFLSTKNVRKYGFEFQETAFISKKKHELLRSGTLSRGDIVITTRGTLGNVASYDANVPFDVVRINSGMLILRKIEPALENEFFKMLIASPSFQTLIDTQRSGSAQPQLPAKIIREFQVSIPSIQEQSEIVRRVEQLFAYADQLESKVATAKGRIDHLTQSILAKAFRGELVPQDPNDEPASVLLARIQAQRVATPKAKRGSKST
ncbi:restriction endonuclease subunit S [Pseudomonas sp. GL-B-19]|uniref:restriction endonuclease subunit S n=1 Tax=Pseudomonas sp. GL-B-19 TaxID=2832393 RepID=UPI001CBF6E3B|nr:restriction endonuclease subunit S [Pseudomonas sp. GL-B-19]